MRALKIVIADTDHDFCELLTGYIRFRNDLEVLGVSGDGEKVVQLINEKKPNVLVMNPTIKNSTVLLSYLRKIGGSPETPAFFQTSGHFLIPISSQWSGSPCGQTTAQIADLSQYMRNMPEPASTAEHDGALELQVSGLMRQLGIPAHLKGYRYLRKAIITAAKNPAAINGITKILYPEIAKAYGTTASCVERAMRKAIEVAWARGDVDVLQHYFGYTTGPETDKPSNSEFIAAAVRILYSQQDHSELLACV